MNTKARNFNAQMHAQAVQRSADAEVAALQQRLDAVEAIIASYPPLAQAVQQAQADVARAEAAAEAERQAAAAAAAEHQRQREIADLQKRLAALNAEGFSPEAFAQNLQGGQEAPPLPEVPPATPATATAPVSGAPGAGAPAAPVAPAMSPPATGWGPTQPAPAAPAAAPPVENPNG